MQKIGPNGDGKSAVANLDWSSRNKKTKVVIIKSCNCNSNREYNGYTVKFIDNTIVHSDIAFKQAMKPSMENRAPGFHNYSLIIGRNNSVIINSTFSCRLYR